MKKIIFEIFILTLISFLIIFYKFNSIPKNLAFDEVEFAQLALSLDKTPYSAYNPAAFGHSTLYFYVLLGSFKIFGINNFALRLPAAIFGVAGVVMFYLIMRALFDKKNYLISLAPFLSSIIFATSRWYFNFARFSFEATFLLFLELTSLYFLIKFLKRKGTNNLYLCAIFAGLSFLSYLPGRIFFILPLVFLIAFSNKKYIALYLIIVAITILPLVSYLISHPDYRFQELFSMSSLGENLKKTLLMFNISGDMNGRHNFPGKPALNPAAGLLFLFGLIISIKNFSNFNNQLMLGYFIISLLPTLFTIPKDNPNMLRTFTALPSTIYFSILPLSFFLNLKSKFKNYFLPAFCILFLLSSLYELRTYFVFQSRVFRNSFEITCPLKEIKDLYIHAIPKKCRVQKNEF